MKVLLEKNKRKGQQIGLVVTTAALAVAFLYLVLLYRNREALAFQEEPCAFSRVLHLYCPGCGGTRAVKSLLEGHLIDSLLANPIPLYSIALILRVWVALAHNVVWQRFRERGNPQEQQPARAKPNRTSWRIMYQWEMWGILVVVAGFFVLRNLALVLLKWDSLGDLVQFW